jgi:3-oxoacyl-[acyl-carrier protein] reductase
MSRLLEGKVAVVTGASKGIGAGIAKELAAEGASLIVNYASSSAGAEAVVAAIVKGGGKAVAVKGDVSKAAEAQGLIAAAIKNFGRLDILVNNSGLYEFAPIEGITEEHFHKLFNVNVLGLLLTTQAAVPHLGVGASIINIGSGVSRITPPNSAVYSATKGAVDAITGVLAKELGPKGIRVNSVNPGVVETEGTTTSNIIGSDFEKGLVAQTPLGRYAQPRDIATVVTFLASEKAGWLTGETILAAGGMRSRTGGRPDRSVGPAHCRKSSDARREGPAGAFPATAHLASRYQEGDSMHPQIEALVGDRGARGIDCIFSHDAVSSMWEEACPKPHRLRTPGDPQLL